MHPLKTAPQTLQYLKLWKPSFRSFLKEGSGAFKPFATSILWGRNVICTEAGDIVKWVPQRKVNSLPVLQSEVTPPLFTSLKFFVVQSLYWIGSILLFYSQNAVKTFLPKRLSNCKTMEPPGLVPSTYYFDLVPSLIAGYKSWFFLQSVLTRGSWSREQ